MNRTDQSKIKYTSYKNALTKILRIEKQKYYSKQFSLYKNDTRNTWKIIKEAMNLSNNKPSISRIIGQTSLPKILYPLLILSIITFPQ